MALPSMPLQLSSKLHCSLYSCSQESMRRPWPLHTQLIPSCGRRLKLREMLLPQVVDRQQLRDTRSRPDVSNGKSNGSIASIWAVPAELFPRSLSDKSKRLADEVSLQLHLSTQLQRAELASQAGSVKPCGYVRSLCLQAQITNAGLVSAFAPAVAVWVSSMLSSFLAVWKGLSLLLW